MRLRILAIAGLLGAALAAQSPALTTVADSLYLANGTITVVASHDFVTPDGVQIPQGQEWTVQVTNGAFSVALPPNIGSTPSGTSYTAMYNVTPGGQYSRTWIVPQSSTPVTLADVQSVGPAPTPAVMFPLSQVTPLADCVLGVPQINSAGNGWQCSTPLVNPMTTAGDMIVGGASGAPGRVPAGTSGYVWTANGPGVSPTWQPGGAAGVSSFNSRTGAVVPATNDYAFSQISGLLAAGQLPASFTAPLATACATTNGCWPDTAAAIDALGALTNSTSGNAGTATALAATPTQCPSTEIVTGVQANGDANCQDPLVSGPTAIGSAPGVNNPVFMAGWDGTDIRALLTDSSGRPIVNINGTVSVSGTFWQTTQPVSIASLPTLAAGANDIGSVDQHGTWNVGVNVALPAGSNNIGTVTAVQPTGSNLHTDVDNFPSTQTVSGTVTSNQGGAPWTITAQPSSASAAALTNFTPAYITSTVTIDSSPGNLFTFQAHDSGTATCYLEFFNAASGSVTLGTTAPIWVVGMFPTASNSYEVNAPAGFALNFSTALSVAAVTTENGSTACPATTAFLNAGYK